MEAGNTDDLLFELISEDKRRKRIPKQKFRKPRRIPIPALRVLAALQNSTKSYNEIGKSFGISRQAVHQLCVRARKEGIKIPARPLGRPLKTKVKDGSSGAAATAF